MTTPRKIAFAEIARRITGISIPVFGVSWNPPESKRNIARRVIRFFEDRRALYADFHMEYGPWVEQSVLEMRAELTEVLKSCPDDEALLGPLQAMRAACRKFLDEMGHPGNQLHRTYRREALMWEALGELRGIFGLHLARLCAAFGIDAQPELASIFPIADAAEAEL